LSNTNNIYKTIKETNPINGYFGYSFIIDETNHFVYGETKEEAFNFVADYINEYLKYGEAKQLEQSNIRQKKMRKSKENKRSKGQTD
jgi:hypothetical protein